MQRRSDYWTNSVEQWWLQERFNAEFPGRLTLVFGAGISMDAPTSLPSGVRLTEALMEHLLNPRACEEILEIFRKCETTTGRSVPRLEHVLDIACNREALNDPISGAPRELLRIFGNRQPNVLHRTVAKHLAKKKGWAITTNFDDCVERASNFSIPVYLMNPSRGTLEVLHASDDPGWGLIKVHGTIEHGVGWLGATLADFDGGLQPPMQSLLDRVMNESDLVAVVGYSGSDHFDINRWIAGRMNARHKPKLIWIQHGDKEITPFIGNETLEPNVTWASAFSGRCMLHGPTRKHLSALLTIPIEQETSVAAETSELDLPAALAALFQPGVAQKHLNGARLATAIGIGQLAEEELRCAESKAGPHRAFDQLRPDVFEQSGFLREAELLNANSACDVDAHRCARVRIARERGSSFKALGLALRLMHTRKRVYGEHRAGVFAEFAHAALDLVEAWQRVPLSRAKIVRWPLKWIIDFFWQAYSIRDDRLGAHLTGRLQQLRLRRMALLEDLDDDLVRFIWGAVTDQTIYPNHLEEWLALPGFFLTRLSTLKELDQLSDWAKASLEFANILTTVITRCQRANRRQTAESRRAMTNDIFYGAITRFIEEAHRVADALGEPHLQVEVSKALVRIDKAVNGLAYLRPQRLYLAAKKHGSTAPS